MSLSMYGLIAWYAAASGCAHCLATARVRRKPLRAFRQVILVPVLWVKVACTVIAYSRGVRQSKPFTSAVPEMT